MLKHTTQGGSTAGLGIVATMPLWIERIISVPATLDDASWWIATAPWYVWGLARAGSGLWVGFAWASDIGSVLRRDWPDFAKWDGEDQLPLYVAACLWEEREPRLPMPRLARARYRRWRDAIYKGDIRYRSRDIEEAVAFAFERTGLEPRTTIEPEAMISRTELRRLAEEAGEQPRFLFRHRRGET